MYKTSSSPSARGRLRSGDTSSTASHPCASKSRLCERNSSTSGRSSMSFAGRVSGTNVSTGFFDDDLVTLNMVIPSSSHDGATVATAVSSSDCCTCGVSLGMTVVACEPSDMLGAGTGGATRRDPAKDGSIAVPSWRSAEVNVTIACGCARAAASAITAAASAASPARRACSRNFSARLHFSLAASKAASASALAAAAAAFSRAASSAVLFLTSSAAVNVLVVHGGSVDSAAVHVANASVCAMTD
mmetsp:Transcript_27899/g.85176  ORF Transcript_27899/g.85176 Transcript_27899/m.85176 type:complete len:245 (+) Transcript_27899:986-1720(+)